MSNPPVSHPPAEPAPLPPPKARNAVWRTLQFILQNVFCFWLGYRARGQERLDAAAGGLVLAYHQSFLDPLLIGVQLHRPVSYVARDSLFKVPVVGWILRNTYVMPISRESASSASLRETIRRMQHGFLVGLFPEGTRTETGEVGPFKPGFVASPMTAHLPQGKLYVPASKAGACIHQAILKRRDIAYVPFFWLFIMLVIKSIPELVFKRLKL